MVDASRHDPLIYALGELTVAMGQMDSLLTGVFGSISGTDPATAQAILMQHTYASQRRDTICAAVEARRRRLGNELADRIVQLMGRASNVSKRRNRFVHDLWALDVSAGKWLLTQELKPGKSYGLHHAPKHVEATEVQRVVDEAKSCAHDLVLLWIDLADFDRPADPKGRPGS